ncbi:phenylalanine--tRNA ligase subunit alpha [Persicimonas caeni]|jgi:phenylalanyl-tRNA synthetase alpha chain|uniref:Phenylalanine--tRNA ligase alpha subunit n=1 Tax=Persicimonas caeni TaxID=2292766 RepID=A0A4Y6PPV5_PERCE|nr:phenylalanine--tRNA ligase subunit alpha [Persicimonas caeni]QDG49795.1 phenylalanine--tRNA ligase subunit alpha [Persicimonas caeni]QED31016.1 phenylalanine--tRNA ligase subunit alpha [Persicimonas caeni]
MNVSELETKLEQLADEAVGELEGAERKEDAIQIKNRYLGRKGGVQELMKLIRELPNEEKPAAGQASNRAKGTIQQAFEARVDALEKAELERRLQSERIDVTLPARTPAVRGGHPLAEVEQELISVFADMGFDVAKGPEVEEDFYNFEALNFPPDHPARDMQDTFVLEDGRLLRTHTSPVQVRTMLAYEPPVRVISPGRVYRCDADVTHSPVFHQVEGLLVDEDVTFADLKGTLHHFAERVFGPGTPVRFRPSYFPFTEPSAEVDVGCIFCEGEGCRVCSHTGWLEILGAGMVDPNVFEAVGVDSDKYTGFAFGMGVERIAMLKLGINDIRTFFENDLRFLRQF